MAIKTCPHYEKGVAILGQRNFFMDGLRALQGTLFRLRPECQHGLGEACADGGHDLVGADWVK